MKNHLPFLLLLLLLISCQQEQKTDKNESILEKKDVQRVVVVGGSLISSMENYGFFEKSIIQNFPANTVSFRNIGWPADDVFGLARSQFGSAQNTRSWQPPSAEEGFGSKVLMEHITEAAPKTLIIAYGSNVAFSKNEGDFDLFKSGYNRLLDFSEKKGAKLILLSPPKQEKSLATSANLATRNDWLAKASNFIKEEANNRGHHFIDLYEALITDANQQTYTQNGVQLNQAGYERLNDVLLENLGIKKVNGFTLKVDEKAKILEHEKCETSDWTTTVNGVSFNLTPDEMVASGKIISKDPIAVYVNGHLSTKSQDSISLVNLRQDSLQQERILATIKEKNRLNRYRLRPLNEAYIYLFRRHEMGHLAYEMDDLKKLVIEKEKEINRLITSQVYDVEIELIKPWSPPKDYPEDEVPAFIPIPNIAAEIDAFHIADGYEISLFAADPMIANPININWDTKGRAWVATSSTYPHIVPGREPNDKIIILEDTDGDGKADKHTVFAENLLVPHSVMPVKGGAYVVATTELLFFADTDGDDVADERHVIYDGFGNADIHHTIHGLRWTPWGNLHFMQSIYINSFLETPYGNRILNGSGTWSFRPESEHIEIFSRGLVNPWGEAFDQWGQAFATDGAGGSGMNYIYPESAHPTAVGAAKVLAGLNSGTPKNTAAEVIYSRHFPADWQGTVITNDYRANRTVRYQLKPHQSGYQSKEVETLLKSDHRSYRPVDTKIGPDGALYIVDWYNPIIDHGEVDFHHPIRDKTHGRIWKLTKKGSPLLKPVNTQVEHPVQLLNLLKSPEQFTRLQANRAYVEQNGDPKAVVNWIKSNRGNTAQAAQYRLEGLWLLAALNHYDEETILNALKEKNPQARAAAVRQFSNWRIAEAHQDKLAKLIEDEHPQVRLEAIHALRKMGGINAVELVTKVLDHPMDDNLSFALDLTLSRLKEAWLPKMVDNVRLFDGDIDKKGYALLTTEDPRIIAPLSQLLGQKELASTIAKSGWKVLAKIGDAAAKGKVLEKAIQEKDASLLKVMSNAPAIYSAIPDNLSKLETLLNSDNDNLKTAAIQLASRWKVSQFADLILQKTNESSDVNEKIAGFKALVNMDKLAEVKQTAQTATKAADRTAASVVWITEAPQEAVKNAVSLLGELDNSDLAELLFLTFRRIENGPTILQKALEGKSLSEAVATVGLKVVQSSGLNLKELDGAIRTAGNIQPVGMQLSAIEKSELIEAATTTGNRRRGRQIYRRPELLCGSCHQTQREGGLAGPNLSIIGSFMTPSSILEAVINPNAEIKQNYETVLITKKNGEIISGLLHRKTDNATLIRQANSEIIEIPTEEIAETDVSPVSLMPTGLTRNLSKDELKDLLAYLISLGK